MPVVQSAIKAELLALFNAAKAAPMTEADFADGMATAIMNAIQSGTVSAGIAVQVTPATGTGATTGPGVIV